MRWFWTQENCRAPYHRKSIVAYPYNSGETFNPTRYIENTALQITQSGVWPGRRLLNHQQFPHLLAELYWP